MGCDMGKIGMIPETKAGVVIIRVRGKSLNAVSVDKHKDLSLVEDYKEGSSGVDYKERCVSDML